MTIDIGPNLLSALDGIGAFIVIVLIFWVWSK